MRKTFAIALLASVAAFGSAYAGGIGGGFGGHTPAISSGAEIKVNQANKAPTVAIQITPNTDVRVVTKDFELSNQAVGSAIDIESSQAVKSVKVDNYNSGLTIAGQYNGKVSVQNVGGSVTVSNVGVGATTNIKLNKTN